MFCHLLELTLRQREGGGPNKKKLQKKIVSFHLILKLVLLNGCFDCFLSKVFLTSVYLSKYFEKQLLSSVRGF